MSISARAFKIQMSIFLQTSASIQPRPSPPKFQVQFPFGQFSFILQSHRAARLEIHKKIQQFKEESYIRLKLALECPHGQREGDAWRVGGGVGVAPTEDMCLESLGTWNLARYKFFLNRSTL